MWGVLLVKLHVQPRLKPLHLLAMLSALQLDRWVTTCLFVGISKGGDLLGQCVLRAAEQESRV